MNKRRRTILAFLAGALLASGSTARAAQTKAGQVTKDEFFIISSFNLQKHELVLKRPSEVTLRMSVTDKTSIVDEHGKPLAMPELHSGDTVYITYRENGTGAEALRIRLGPMTVEELQRRYLKNDAPPPRPAPAPAPMVSPPRAHPRAGQEKSGPAKPGEQKPREEKPLKEKR